MQSEGLFHPVTAVRERHMDFGCLSNYFVGKFELLVKPDTEGSDRVKRKVARELYHVKDL